MLKNEETLEHICAYKMGIFSRSPSEKDRWKGNRRASPGALSSLHIMHYKILVQYHATQLTCMPRLWRIFYSKYIDWVEKVQKQMNITSFFQKTQKDLKARRPQLDRPWTQLQTVRSSLHSSVHRSSWARAWRGLKNWSYLIWSNLDLFQKLSEMTIQLSSTWCQRSDGRWQKFSASIPGQASPFSAYSGL